MRIIETLNQSWQSEELLSRLAPPGQTRTWTHDVLNMSMRSSVRLSVCHQISEDDISKTNEAILIPIGTRGPRGKSMKRSTLWIHSLGVSTCLTSQQHRLMSIRLFCRILLPCPCYNFVVKRSKVKVTRGQRQILRPGWDIVLDRLLILILTNNSQSSWSRPIAWMGVALYGAYAANVNLDSSALKDALGSVGLLLLLALKFKLNYYVNFYVSIQRET